MKKLSVLVLAFALTLQMSCVGRNVADAAYITPENAAVTLGELGLLKDNGNGDFLLSDSLTRQEGIVMLCRLVGLDDENGFNPVEPCPFGDVALWAQRSVSRAYEVGLIRGVDGGTLGAENGLSLRDWLTFLLRALGYSDPDDFVWTKAVDFAASKGISIDVGEGFSRGDAVTLAYEALLTKKNGSDVKLIESLIESGNISREALKNSPLAGYANYGKPIFNSADIYERASATAFYMEVYDTKEDFDKKNYSGTASGFFISQDGAALISYHAIERKPYLSITTTDGRVYNDVKVLWRDGWRDLALIKVGKTDTEGNSVTKFPYLPLGDSDLITVGEPVFTVGSPIGLTDTLTDGLISAKARNVSGPGYPEIQFTAPVSPGSSGGALINRYGEAVGVVKGAYVNGNNLNLAVPVNFVPLKTLSAAGITVKEAADEDDALNLASTLTADRLSVSVKEGAETTVIITRDSPGTFVLQYQILDSTICSAVWGEFVSITDTELTIRGKSAGKTTITITYADGTGNPETEVVIAVSVRK
ncbi:MAG: S1C family serine protease [Oscillospiraceae bacterium]|jgi:S1-C subfamily serine protease|nr:S1C family serine protease [Oscillospiraceae bacterium]